jgi:hypothetical protein
VRLSPFTQNLLASALEAYGERAPTLLLTGARAAPANCNSRRRGSSRC